MHRLFATSAVLACVLVGLTTTTGAQPQPVARDINGDGKGDLVVGVPLEGVGGRTDAGSVNVVFSNGKRLHPSKNLWLSQADVGADRESDDLFGAAVELVDVDGDGRSEVVVGASGEDVGSVVDAGVIHVIPGRRSGLRLDAAEMLVPGESGMAGTAESNDFFGFNLASGDFNGDGFGDVVASAPFETVNQRSNAGAVTIIYGSGDGLDPSTSHELSQLGDVAGTPERGDTFGWALAVGDFDNDGHDDLAVGVPGEDRGGRVDTGSVNVLYGGPAGIGTAGNRSFSQAGKIKNSPEVGDLFGFAVATSDMNCDGVDDLIVGAPNEGVRNVEPAGLVHVILGSNSGLGTRGNVKLDQRGSKVAGQLDYNQFGAALAGGDFDGDGCGDIAVGAHTTDVGGTGRTLCAADPACAREAGAVVTVRGDRRWPTTGGTAQFTQAGEVPGKPQRKDFFGRTLAVVDIDGNGRDDLVVGTPREDIGRHKNAGSVTILRGTSRGLTSRNSYSLSQAGAIGGAPERGDQFSSALLDTSS